MTGFGYSVVPSAGLTDIVGEESTQVAAGGVTVSTAVLCTNCEGLERDTLAVTVWFVGELGDEVGVAVTVVVLEAPGAMLSAALETPALAAPVTAAAIENEPALQTELSLLMTVSVKLAGLGYSVLRLVGLRLTVGSAGWQTGARVTVKFELDWTVCDGFERAALAVIEYVLWVEGAEVGVTVTVVVFVAPGATDRDEGTLAEIFPAVWPPSFALALIENEVAEQALLSLLVSVAVKVVPAGNSAVREAGLSEMTGAAVMHCSGGTTVRPASSSADCVGFVRLALAETM